jgi:NADPH2:quinone reductase
VPCGVTTAWGVLEAAQVQPGETVLVLAAAGGVGSAAVQLAVAQGAIVVAAVGHDAKRGSALSWGARHAVTYDELAGLGDLIGGRRVDVVLDPVGGPVRRAAAATLGFGGRHVVYGDAAGGDVVVTSTVWSTGTSLVGYSLGALAAAAPERLRTHLTDALHAVADGTVGLDVTERPLAEVAAVHLALEARTSTGTGILRVGGGRRTPSASSPGVRTAADDEW